MAIEIVDFPINSMVIFHSKMLVHQRVWKYAVPVLMVDMKLNAEAFGDTISVNAKMGQQSVGCFPFP